MQVTHVQDHISHAVIGGGQTIDFGISNSAEFFNILSSTLYKDQILAVVRETLCNAWDAHIEAGCTHIPVQVTFTSDKMVIKDSGKGIHRDDMGLVYGTYGNSTKKNDGQQTGGFGLGCKSPFAYTDHFEVISSNDGVRTIYNLSKSSAQVQGKPGIIPIASFPTTETGLQVSLAIKNRQDLIRFKHLVERIACNGDMNVEVDGKAVDKLGFDTSKSNYLVTRKDGIIDNETHIMVRYGNVVYPVDMSQELKLEYTQIINHLTKLGGSSNRVYYHIIFQAPPHSISVTPSRESLSMQEHTVNTLMKLFTDFLALIDKPLTKVCNEYAEATVKVAVAEKKISLLLNRDRKLPNVQWPGRTDPVHISDLQTMAARYMVSNYPSSPEFRKQDIRFRLTQLVQAGLLNRGLVQTFLKDLEQTGKGHENNQWLHRRVIAPLITKLMKVKMDHTRLCVFDGSDPRTRVYKTSLEPLLRASMASPVMMSDAMPYLRNIIVVTASRTDIAKRVVNHDAMAGLGKFDGYLVYHCSMKAADKTAALDFFKQTGMVVIDLTVKQDWEIVEQPVKGDKPPKKPKQQGLPALSSAHNPQARHLDLRYTKSDTAKRVLNPEAVLGLTFGKYDPTKYIVDWDEASTRRIIALVGDKVGITHLSTTRTKWINAGAKDFKAWFLDKLFTEMETNPRIHEYWACHPQRVIDQVTLSGSAERMCNIIFNNPMLSAEYGLKNSLTEDDKHWVALWDYYVDRYSYRGDRPQRMDAIIKKLKAIKLVPEATKVGVKLKTNELVCLLDTATVARMLITSKLQSPEAVKVLQIIRTILQ